jgi:hypothetical protein
VTELQPTRSTLDSLFQAQAEFQRSINAHPETMEDPEELIQYIKDMRLALEDELAEMFQEIGWKPWASSRHIDYPAARSELRDAFQFFMNLCFALKMGPEELIAGVFEKLEKNYARAEAGYDGVTGKCSGCKRAYDDDAVRCYEDPLHPGYSICFYGVETK